MTHHTTSQKTPRHCLLFLCRLWRLNTDSRILINFCRCTMESILTGCIKPGVAVAPPSTTRTAQHLNSSKLPPLEELYSKQCWKKAKRIIKHPKHKLFCLLPTGRRYRTTGLRDSFIPQAIRPLNS